MAQSASPQQSNNTTFLQAITESFRVFLEKGTSRSTDKLKPLHGFIAEAIAIKLGSDYAVWSQGYGKGKEATINGRYHDKRVDITIKRKGKPIAGIGVKFIMQNYSQNNVNYFENMLGETANIRCNSHPYFQVFIIFDKLPYYNKEKELRRWETFTDHNVEKYIKLSNDDHRDYRHTPDKTLVYVVHLPDPQGEQPTTQEEYLDYYRTLAQSHRLDISLSSHDYGEVGPTVIFNDFDTFVEKVAHTILAI